MQDNKPIKITAASLCIAPIALMADDLVYLDVKGKKIIKVVRKGKVVYIYKERG